MDDAIVLSNIEFNVILLSVLVGVLGVLVVLVVLVGVLVVFDFLSPDDSILYLYMYMY